MLVIGEEGGQLLALSLTSRDHDVDAAQEHGAGREWMDIGTGAWDAQRRPSEVRLNRLLRLDPAGVRREGAALLARTFRRRARGGPALPLSRHPQTVSRAPCGSARPRPAGRSRGAGPTG